MKSEINQNVTAEVEVRREEKEKGKADFKKITEKQKEETKEMEKEVTEVIQTNERLVGK